MSEFVKLSLLTTSTSEANREGSYPPIKKLKEDNPEATHPPKHKSLPQPRFLLPVLSSNKQTFQRYQKNLCPKSGGCPCACRCRDIGSRRGRKWIIATTTTP